MNDNGFNFSFKSAKEIDERFNSILDLCKDLDGYQEIERIVRDRLEGLVFPALVLEPGDKLTVYRVTVPFPGIDETCLDHFSYNRELGKVERNRANIAGCPVLYTAFNEATALKELKDKIIVDMPIFISEWKIDMVEPILLYNVVPNSITASNESFISEMANVVLKKSAELFSKIPEFQKEGFERLIIRIGDLFSFKGSEYYNISSAIAHNLLYEAKLQGINVSVLCYPSIAVGHKMLNYAFHPDFVNSSNMKLNKVIEYRVNKWGEDHVVGTMKRIGVNESGKIRWLRKKFSIKSISWNSLRLLTSSNNECRYSDENVPKPDEMRLIETMLTDALPTFKQLINGENDFFITDTITLKRWVEVTVPPDRCTVQYDNVEEDIVKFGVEVVWEEEFV